jgi:hypothetical protein
LDGGEGKSKSKDVEILKVSEKKAHDFTPSLPTPEENAPSSHLLNLKTSNSNPYVKQELFENDYQFIFFYVMYFLRNILYSDTFPFLIPLFMFPLHHYFPQNLLFFVELLQIYSFY